MDINSCNLNMEKKNVNVNREREQCYLPRIVRMSVRNGGRRRSSDNGAWLRGVSKQGGNKPWGGASFCSTPFLLTFVETGEYHGVIL